MLIQERKLVHYSVVLLLQSGQVAALVDSFGVAAAELIILSLQLFDLINRTSACNSLCTAHQPATHSTLRISLQLTLHTLLFSLVL